MLIKIMRISTVDEALQVIEEIEINEIQTPSVDPLKDKVGTLLTLTDFSDLVSQIKPAYSPDDADIYFAQLPVSVDLDSKKQSLDVPHHIGFRMVANIVLQKFADQDNLKIEIS